jgi:hypothetical protein
MSTVERVKRTFDTIREKIEVKSEELLKERFEELADLAIYTAVLDKSIDTGAYVTSFSIGPAGFGGGRSRSSKNKPRRQDPSSMKATARGQLQSDISAIDFTGLMTSGSLRATLRNRAPHANAVEKKYHVFATIKDLSR